MMTDLIDRRESPAHASIKGFRSWKADIRTLTGGAGVPDGTAERLARRLSGTLLSERDAGGWPCADNG